jgi:hypothetical protein
VAVDRHEVVEHPEPGKYIFGFGVAGVAQQRIPVAVVLRCFDVYAEWGLAQCVLLLAGSLADNQALA